MHEQLRQPRFADRSRHKLRVIMPEYGDEATGVVFNLIRASSRIVQDLAAHVHRPAGCSG